jgi:integrase
MKMPKAKPSNARKMGLLDDEIRKLFASPIYARNERPRGGAGECSYWLPILSLYTGARQGELAQLNVNDVVEVEGVRCLAIRDDGEGASDSPFAASLKTDESYRVIPLPKKLIDLGFLDFVAWVGTGPLFPKLKPNRYGKIAQNWSKWYNRSRREWGIIRPRADFHAIRHTVKTRLRNAEGDHEAKLKLVGHSSGNVSENYGSVSPKAMKKLIDQIEYSVTIPNWKRPGKLAKAA